MAIELTLQEPTPQPPIESKESINELTQEQLDSLIGAISSANPPVLTLPQGKSFADVQVFRIAIKPNNSAQLLVRFK
jgi:hypothetical protein